jgi:hypothetical protein
MKEAFQARGAQKQAGVAMLMSKKADFKQELVRRDKEGHFILMKGTIQEDITIANVYDQTSAHLVS